jgi:hypothetical protein
VSDTTPESRLAELARKATLAESDIDTMITRTIERWHNPTALPIVHSRPLTDQERHALFHAIKDLLRKLRCDPATILRLVEENGRLRRVIEKAAADLDDAELGEGVQTNLPYIARDLDMALGKKPRTTYV